jgi:hypothetical protein
VSDGISGTTFCISVSLEGALKRGPEACALMLKHADGTPLSGQDAYDLMWQKWLDGFEVLPVCDNHDPRGHCLGHPIKAQ